MSSTERTKEPLSVHDLLPRVSSFFLFIPLKAGTIIIGILSIVYCGWHICLLNNRQYYDNKNTEMIKSFWKIIMTLSNITLSILGVVLVFAVVQQEVNLARLWLLAALQNGILLLIFEFFACPLHCEDPVSKIAFKMWPYTYLYCIIPFVMLYCMYVVNSYIVTIPKPRSYPPCEIPMTEQ